MGLERLDPGPNALLCALQNSKGTRPTNKQMRAMLQVSSPGSLFVSLIKVSGQSALGNTIGGSCRVGRMEQCQRHVKGRGFSYLQASVAAISTLFFSISLCHNLEFQAMQRYVDGVETPSWHRSHYHQLSVRIVTNHSKSHIAQCPTLCISVL